jgi:hypothetical protein
VEAREQALAREAHAQLRRDIDQLLQHQALIGRLPPLEDRDERGHHGLGVRARKVKRNKDVHRLAVDWIRTLLADTARGRAFNSLLAA